jgi:hypothetical protein
VEAFSGALGGSSDAIQSFGGLLLEAGDFRLYHESIQPVRIEKDGRSWQLYSFKSERALTIASDMPTSSLCRSGNPNRGAVVLEKRGYR